MAEIKELVNHPDHYNMHPSGVECIDIIQHMNFCLGNAVKYIWRADLKNDAIQDLEKAIFYLNQEIQRRTNETRDQEERSRDFDVSANIESNWTPGTKKSGAEADNKERSLSDSEYFLQHDKAWENYFRTQGAYGLHSSTKGSK